jgi:hypothetical protein
VFKLALTAEQAKSESVPLWNESMFVNLWGCSSAPDHIRLIKMDNKGQGPACDMLKMWRLHRTSILKNGRSSSINIHRAEDKEDQLYCANTNDEKKTAIAAITSAPTMLSQEEIDRILDQEETELKSISRRKAMSQNRSNLKNIYIWTLQLHHIRLLSSGQVIQAGTEWRRLWSYYESRAQNLKERQLHMKQRQSARQHEKRLDDMHRQWWHERMTLMNDERRQSRNIKRQTEISSLRAEIKELEELVAYSQQNDKKAGIDVNETYITVDDAEGDNDVEVKQSTSSPSSSSASGRRFQSAQAARDARRSRELQTNKKKWATKGIMGTRELSRELEKFQEQLHEIEVEDEREDTWAKDEVNDIVAGRPPTGWWPMDQYHQWKQERHMALNSGDEKIRMKWQHDSDQRFTMEMASIHEWRQKHRQWHQDIEDKYPKPTESSVAPHLSPPQPDWEEEKEKFFARCPLPRPSLEAWCRARLEYDQRKDRQELSHEEMMTEQAEASRVREYQYQCSCDCKLVDPKASDISHVQAIRLVPCHLPSSFHNL